MDPTTKILLAEDSQIDADLARREIRSVLNPCEFHIVETREAYLAALAEFQPDLIVSDYRMPRFDGLTALKLALQQERYIPVIIFTGAINEDTAVECMKAGAADYVIKEHIKRLGQAVLHALEEKEIRRKRMAAESELRASEERYRTLVETMPDALVVTNQEGQITFASPTAIRLFHCHSEQELVGQNILERIHADMVAEAAQLQDDLLAGNNVNSHEYLFRQRSQNYVEVELSASGLRDANAEVIGSVIILRDVTERKQAEQAKAQLEEQLRQAQKLESIGRLAGGIAHDFNNLLIPIIGFTDLVQIQLPEESPSRKHLTKIRTAADKATRLTRQILAFSRQQVLEMEIIDLCQIITEFKDILQRLIGENIRLHFKMPNDPCLLNADRTQIEQVLLNLGVNARDAMPAGGDMIIETDHVYLDATYVQTHPDASEGPHIRLTVSDSGVGMDTDTVDHIFEPFFTTKEKGKGTGLGLATVFGIIKQHKGSLSVASQPDKGTSFNIYLPYPAGSTPSTPRKKPELATVAGSETILVVEDEMMVRRLICEALTAYGYDVIEAGDGQEALELMRVLDRPVQLLLTDLIMPGINGRQLYEQLAHGDPDLKVLYISGYTDDVIGQHGVLENDVNFLHKPFSVYRLAQEIRNVLNELCEPGS